MTVVGGLRTRFIYDSVYNALNDGLTELGWFDAGRGHEPVTFLDEPIGDTEEVQLNTLAFSEGTLFERDFEAGSNMAEAEYSFFVDIYAQSGALGRHIANDLRDLVKGRHGGRSWPVFTIYDYRTATPTNIGWLEVERVNVIKEDAFTRPWHKFWYTVRFDLMDHYLQDE